MFLTLVYTDFQAVNKQQMFSFFIVIKNCVKFCQLSDHVSNRNVIKQHEKYVRMIKSEGRLLKTIQTRHIRAKAKHIISQ